MVEKPKSENISLKLVTNHENYMESLVENIEILRNHYNWSVQKLAEKADMSPDSLRSLLRGKAKDCNLVTVVKLARAFNISIDELIGAETIHPLSRESFAICRNLPDHFVYIVRSYIRHINKMIQREEQKEHLIPVILPKCQNGSLKTTSVTEVINVNHLSNNIKSKVACGIKIPCDHYEPHYMPDETILLAVDRDGLHNEECVVSYRGNYFLAIKKFYIENGIKKIKYVSILDGKTEMLRNEIDDKLGYVIGFLNPDGSFGIR